MELQDRQILAAKGDSVEATSSEPPTWQQAMKSAIRDGNSLCQRLGLPTQLSSDAAALDFPIFAPLEYVRRMEYGNPRDPLLLQVLGQKAETHHDPSAALDPVGDLPSERHKGLLQKYDRRVLLITSGACAIHCRYCFRRHFPYDEAPKGIGGWEQSLQTIASDDSIDEVILSGGDPLTVADRQLTELMARINAIPHISRIRFHTRVPVVIPQRVGEELLECIRRSRAAVFFVLHFNHAAEIDAAVQSAMKRLRRAGATLLNQSVLLRDINDSTDAQMALCLQLTNLHVMPYYLHQLDRVQGATHFAIPDERARQIIEHLRANLPGYAVPRLVREIAGQASKTPV